MKQETTYEWDVETLCEPVKHDDGTSTIDIDDHWFFDTLEEAVRFVEDGSMGKRCNVALVKSVGNDEDGVQDREWFYVGKSGIEKGCPKKYETELRAKGRLNRLNVCANFMSQIEQAENEGAE